MEIFTIKHYITEVEKQNRFYEKNCTKSLDIYDRRMYIDNFQFADLKQNTVPYIAVMRFGAWLLIFLRKEQHQMKLVLAEKLSFLPYSFSRSSVRLAISSSRSSSSGSVHLTAFAE